MSKLKLLAFTAEDGWALVRSDQSVLLVRPPYTRSNSSPGPERAVERAVAQHGFSASDQEFPDWLALVEFLNSQVRQTRATRGEHLNQQGLGSQMLEFAPEDVLVTFLDRVGSELLTSGLWASAERLLIDMLNLPQVQRTPELVKRASGLLSRTVEARENAERQRERLVQEESSIIGRFPRLENCFDTRELEVFNKRIIGRGQLLPVGE